ncbi:MAG TPA: hypothetical protein VE980_02885 [Pyrinomonadaceae bacterium]|nr:hypothetical protein [Pyrinomonadaceae bacterium]
MKIKLTLALSILVTCIACSSQAQNFKSFKLPSGKEIKITGMVKMNFPNSDPALVLNYLTDIPIENRVELRKEIDEVWSVFRIDVEKAKLNAGVIRVTHMEGSGFVKSGKGYGYVFVKRDDGWHCTEDDKQTQ